jgi:basic membrane protein A and related proteins
MRLRISRRWFALAGVMRSMIAMSALVGAPTLAASTVPTAPAPTRSSAITTGRPEPVPVAFVYRDRIVDSALAASHELARIAITKEYSGRVASIAVENVATASEADRVFRELVVRGYKVIFATDAVHAAASAKVAAADYDLKIEQVMGTQTLLNVRNYEIRHFEQAYLAGIIAAGQSTSRKLGVVAAMPTAASIGQINAFTLGAQSVDKRATTLVFWAGSTLDSQADSRGAEALIKRGADVLLSMTETDAAARVAEKQRKRVIGWHVDRTTVAPRAQVAAVVLDWLPFYQSAVNESFSYLCTKSDASRGLREGAIKVIGLAPTLSPVASARLRQAQTELIADEFSPFAAAMRTESGAVLPAKNTTLDEAWHAGRTQLLRGVSVVGTAPAVGLVRAR